MIIDDGTRMPTSNEVTRVLIELAEGNGEAAAQLLPLVYDELRKLADLYLKSEPVDHTLQPTALVHEAYIRLVGRNQAGFRCRHQFFSVAAQAMRRLLIDHARRRRALKRGGGRPKQSLNQIDEPSAYRDEYLVSLDDALNELTSIDADLGRVVELRFFGGLTVQETSQVLGVSPMTVKRRWRLARGWLHRAITERD